MTDYDLDKVAAAAVAELAAVRNRAAVHTVLTKVRETVGDQAYAAVLPTIFGALLDQLPRSALALVLPELIATAVAALPQPDDDGRPAVTASAPPIDPARVRIYFTPHLDDKESLK